MHRRRFAHLIVSTALVVFGALGATMARGSTTVVQEAMPRLVVFEAFLTPG